MLSPKKGLLCNLNHIHLQHVSLGLHLSRHPELREGSVTMAPREQTGCSDCQENHGALEQVEQVDANSNNPSLQCRCCESHVPQPLKSGLRNQPALGDFLSLPMEENLASPSDAASSSSVSSCSDFSLDDTPVSVYCKEFPSDETQSPDLQPNIIPIEDARDAAPPTEQGTIMPEGRDSRLSPPEWEHLEALAQGSPDSLCSSSSLNSLSDTTSASVDMPETPGERPLPAVGGELDSNCNALPAMGSSPPGTCALAPGQLDLNLNGAPQPTPGPASGPPPVPPRPKRGLQILLSKMAMEKPAPAEAPAEPMGSLGEPPRDPARKNITSFHELAQKRKRNMAGPPLAQAKKDRSDWLIVFSPDTELPPPSELIACSAQGQELPRPQPQPGKQANPPSSSQREVTTFKELRYRNAINKQRGQLAWGEGAALQELPEPQQAAVGRALPSGEGLQGPSWAPALPLGSHSVAPAESYPPQRKKSRPGLQPIAEGLPGDAEDRGLPSGGCAPRRKQFWSDCEEEASGWRPRGPDGNPQELGRAERGDRTCKEVGSFLSRYPRPQTLPFQPLLFHFSADGKSLYCSSDPAVPPLPFLPSLNSSLESVELKSPVLFAAPFRPPLKTLSCDEACLLASRKGGALGALSPEELLPIRLSPVGAYSPPHRGGLPFLGSPDLSVLLSPFFPRSRTLPTMALPPHEASAPRFGAEGPPGHCAPGAARGRRQPGARPRPAAPERRRSCCGLWESGGAATPRPPKPLRRCRSLAGAPGAARPRMAPAPAPAPACLQLREQKKALLVAVSASVDKIIAHFSAARNLVQKAQLGDSQLSPDVGYLLLRTLCPALYALVGDGLKPFQKDIITGQRRSSPWSVVEASVKPGPGTRSLQALYWHISRLAPLSSSRQRFHAFVLGLLNLKQLELWISWLQKSPGVISVLYLPSAFLALSQGPLPHLADELLLLIQPLSVLTFHLDLLFEHHHLSVDIRPLPDPAPGPTLVPASAAGPAETRGPLTQAQEAQAEGQGSTDRASPEHGAAPDGLGRAGLLGTEDSTRPQLTAAATSLFPSPRVGVSLQQTFQHVLQWGGRLSHVLTGADGPSRSPEHDQGPRVTRAGLGGWWGQLSQASAVYTASGKEDFPFTRWTALRTAPGDPSLTNTSCGAPAKGPSSTELQPLEARTATNATSPDSTSGARGLGLPVQATARESTGPGDPTLPEPAAGDRSQPVLEEPGWGKGAWLGRLFGATCPSARGLPMEPDTSSARPRRPSSWLRPRVSVLSLVRKGTAPEQPWPPEQQKEGPDSPQPHRAVRALCDHAGAGHGYLSFRKGDVLQLMATVDEDWIRCCHKNDTGLVPVSYTSLIV